MNQKPLVTDGADRKQIKNAEQKEQLLRDREKEDWRKVCSMLEGRRVIWRLIGHGKAFESIWENSARIHYNAGQQDFAHFIMSETIKCDPEFLFQMMIENKKGEV